MAPHFFLFKGKIPNGIFKHNSYSKMRRLAANLNNKTHSSHPSYYILSSSTRRWFLRKFDVFCTNVEKFIYESSLIKSRDSNRYIYIFKLIVFFFKTIIFEKKNIEQDGKIVCEKWLVLKNKINKIIMQHMSTQKKYWYMFYIFTK